jgi:Zn ribbon nucleic-acid-binding protein
MYKLKGCPRCRGDLLVNQESNVWFEQCIQCGYEKEMRTLVDLSRRPYSRKKQ